MGNAIPNGPGEWVSKAEIDRLRAELADRERRLEVITRALETSCANVTNRDARIAEQDRDIAAKARNLTHLNARAEKAEAALAIVQSKGGLKEKVALLASENGCLRAELSQTKRDLEDWQDSSEAYRHDAEKAEAQLNQACGREHDAKERCAELEKQCAELSGELETVSIECAEARAALAPPPAGDKA